MLEVLWTSDIFHPPVVLPHPLSPSLAGVAQLPLCHPSLFHSPSLLTEDFRRPCSDDSATFQLPVPQPVWSLSVTSSSTLIGSGELTRHVEELSLRGDEGLKSDVFHGLTNDEELLFRGELEPRGLLSPQPESLSYEPEDRLPASRPRRGEWLDRLPRQPLPRLSREPRP